MPSVRPALVAFMTLLLAGCATSAEPDAQTKRPALDAQAFERALKNTTPATPQPGVTPSRRAP